MKQWIFFGLKRLWEWKFWHLEMAHWYKWRWVFDLQIWRHNSTSTPLTLIIFGQILSYLHPPPSSRLHLYMSPNVPPKKDATCFLWTWASSLVANWRGICCLLFGAVHYEVCSLNLSGGILAIWTLPHIRAGVKRNIFMCMDFAKSYCRCRQCDR